MEYQPIKNSVQSKNGWTIGMPDGFNLFMNETEAILLDEDYDTVVAFIFDEDSVIVKKIGWQAEPKIYFNKKQVDVLMPLEEEGE